MKFIKNLFRKKKPHDVRKLLNSKDLVFDIGAHLGEKSNQFLEKNMNIIMLEPLPNCIAELKKKYKNNQNVTIIQKAVSNKTGEEVLEINTKMPTISTMAAHWKKGRFSDHDWDNKIIVKTTTLDELIKGFGKPNYIKIDVEGYEIEVLLGLTQKVGIISFEFASEFIKNSIICINHLYKLGYEEFNFSIGERRKFFSNWKNKENIIKEIKIQIQKDNLLWGDIYCR
jgi:FkbM family methyltransferase